MKRWAQIVVVAILAVSWIERATATDSIPSARQAIILTLPEQDYLLNEMHENLSALNSIISALSRNDPRSAAHAAATRGIASYGDRDPNRPKTLSAKLPPAWKPMAMSLRQSFDQLAEGMGANESIAETLGRVSQLMAICSGCHASFRIVTQP
jgi:hypothetical protein